MRYYYHRQLPPVKEYDFTKAPMATDDNQGPVINCVTEDGVVDDFRSWDNNIEKYNLAHKQMDSTGRARYYMIASIPKFVMASVGRIAAFRLIASIGPDRATLALATTEVEMSQIPVGETITAKWRGKPVFIANRDEATMQSLKDDDANVSFRDPQTTEDRSNAEYPNWMVSVGICTHLGCIPVMGAGAYLNGYFCPCHGSHYDAASRIRKGPAPLNLEIPEWSVKNGNTILLGSEK